jgi:hypothetical protein
MHAPIAKRLTVALALLILSAGLVLVAAGSNASATVPGGEIIDEGPGGGPCDDIVGNGVPSCGGGIPPGGTLIPCIDPGIPCNDQPGWEGPGGGGPVDDGPIETGFEQRFCQVRIVSSSSHQTLTGNQGVAGRTSRCPKNLDAAGANATLAVQQNFAAALVEIQEIEDSSTRPVDRCTRAGATTGDVLEIRYAVRKSDQQATHPWEGRCLRRKSGVYTSIGARSDPSPPFFFETTKAD